MQQMGFIGALTEGDKTRVRIGSHPHYLYNCALTPKLKLLLRDITLSDDISLRFNNSSWDEYPLFADKYISKITALPEDEASYQLVYGVICARNCTAIIKQYSRILECSSSTSTVFHNKEDVRKQLFLIP